MKMRIERILALVLAAMLLGVIASAEPEAAGEDGVIPAQVGLEAPDFELTTLDGEVFRLSEQRGKVVFLNIWATWCPPCVAEMPAIDALAQAYPDDLVVIGVSCDQSEETVRAFLEQYDYTYCFAIDKDFRLATELYPSYYIPNSIFIDPDGFVTSIETGAASYDVMEQRFLEAQAHAQPEEE